MIVSASVLLLALQLSRLSPRNFEAVSELIVTLGDARPAAAPFDMKRALVRLTDRSLGIGVARDGQVVSTNRFLDNLLGYERGELLEREIASIVAGPYDAVNRPPLPFSRVVPHRHKFGRIIPYHVSSWPMMTAPGELHWITTIEPPDC